MGGINPAMALFVVKTGIGLIQQRQQARAQNAAAAAAAQSQTQQIRRAQEIRERQRREQLRRALASQRASFGAQGIGRGGSADAVLKGLSDDTERRIGDQRSLNDLRIGNINFALEQRRRRNLLELSSTPNRAAFNLLGKGLETFSLLER